MNKLYAKIAATATSVILMGGLFAPSVLADEVISGNGAGSVNGINVTSTTNCAVSQSNSTSAWIGVSSSASTGGNQANGNTGGDVTIGTGNATTTTTITVTGGDNIAVNPCCCPTPCVTGGCCQGEVAPLGGSTPGSVTISGNGAGSTNGVNQASVKNTSIAQTGSTKAGIYAKSKTKTGKNQASGNTGPGSVGVTTGNGTSTTTIGVTGGSNVLP